MTRWILPTLALGSAAALGLAACGTSGSSSTNATSGSSPGIVSVKNVAGAKVLTDTAGKTLYSTTSEQGGRIRCTGMCTSFWAPVLGSQAQAMKASTNLSAKLSTVKRADGRSQLTFNGLPVYTFAEEGAGKLTGDGFKDAFQGMHFTWHADRTNGSTTTASSSSSTAGSGYGY
jgi:predicted lipoprotein with Yx(FWY)xxD motif